MFDKHTYLILVCSAILLVTLCFGTCFVVEGYDDYLNKLLADRGYQLAAAQTPGSSGYYLQQITTCSDGTNRFDHVDSDCSKALKVVTVSAPGAAETCTVTKNSAGTEVDSCKTISSLLFCDTSTNKCNTNNTKELAAGQVCKYNNECLSRTCVGNKCGAVVTPSTSTTSSTALQTLGTNTGSGSGAGVSNLGSYFDLLNNQSSDSTSAETLDQYFQLSSLQGLPDVILPSKTASDTTKTTTTTNTATTMEKATTASPSVTSSTATTPSTSTTPTPTTATRDAKFSNDVKNLMLKDIRTLVNAKMVAATTANSQDCLDSCC